MRSAARESKAAQATRRIVINYRSPEGACLNPMIKEPRARPFQQSMANLCSLAQIRFTCVLRCLFSMQTFSTECSGQSILIFVRTSMYMLIIIYNYDIVLCVHCFNVVYVVFLAVD